MPTGLPKASADHAPDPDINRSSANPPVEDLGTTAKETGLGAQKLSLKGKVKKIQEELEVGPNLSMQKVLAQACQELEIDASEGLDQDRAVGLEVVLRDAAENRRQGTIGGGGVGVGL